jgi:hypothetical protein
MFRAKSKYWRRTVVWKIPRNTHRMMVATNLNDSATTALTYMLVAMLFDPMI